jgi:CheY-like chemotaxis protein
VTKGRTILVVEDDVAFADFIRACVESLGHRAVVINDGADAMAAFAKEQPDLVLLDLLLPRRDGFMICEDIRKHRRGADVPVVMMTGVYRKPQHERQGLERCKANEYLIKPFGVREIWRLIERHLGSSVIEPPADVATPSTTGWSLADSPLACQLAEHMRLRSNGVLFVRAPDATFVIYIRAGAPVFVRSSDPAERLDRVLARTTRLTEANIGEASAVAKESRGRLRLGDVLVDRGLLARDELEVALQLQLRLILGRAFQLERGHCLFVEGEHPTEEDVLLQASPRALLLRGARTTSRPIARRHLPPREATLVRVQGWEALIPDLHLKEDETQLLQLCDGAITVERFLSIAALSGLDGERILLALSCAGLTCDVPADHRPLGPRAVETRCDVAEWKGRTVGLVVADAFRRRATGRLVVVPDGEPPRTLWLRDGSIVSVRSQAEEDRLSHVLARMAVVDEVALHEAVTALGEDATDEDLARHLVAHELLSPTEVYWAAVYQAHGAVHDVLGLVPGSLEWDPTPVPDDVVLLPDLPTIELALNGLRSLEDDVVTEMLPQPTTRLVAVEDANVTACPLDDAERALLVHVGEPRTIESLGVARDVESAKRRRSALALLWLGLAQVTRAAAAPEDLVVVPERRKAPPRARPPAASFDEAHELTLSDEMFMAEAAAEAPVVTPDDIARQLERLRPTLRALRAGFEGSERRVQVDRARMAELLDELLELTQSLNAQVLDALSREPTAV